MHARGDPGGILWVSPRPGPIVKRVIFQFTPRPLLRICVSPRDPPIAGSRTIPDFSKYTPNLESRPNLRELQVSCCSQSGCTCQSCTCMLHFMICSPSHGVLHYLLSCCFAFVVRLAVVECCRPMVVASAPLLPEPIFEMLVNRGRRSSLVWQLLPGSPTIGECHRRIWRTAGAAWVHAWIAAGGQRGQAT